MLGTILEKLQTLFSKNFLIAAFFPVLIFAVVNGALLYTQSSVFQRAIDNYGQDDKGLLDSATIGMTVLVGLSILAFLLSILNTRLREILEGRVFWPRLLAAPFVWRQTMRRDRLKADYDETQRQRTGIESHRNGWQSALKAARLKPKPPGTRCQYPWNDPAAKKVRYLRLRRLAGLAITQEQLQLANNALQAVLARAAIDARPAADGDDAKRLDADQASVDLLAGYAIARHSDRVYRLSGELQFSYPGDAFAPTAMGNVAQSIPGYTYSRYRMNIDLFWTRLQKVMLSEAFYTVLQDAKTQLDALVALSWLTALTMTIWLPYMAYGGADVQPFLAVAIAGPIALGSFYRLAVQNYRAFADLVRACVDLYRLDLLTALKIAQPDTIAAEAQLWATLNRRMNYGSTINITYLKPKP